MDWLRTAFIVFFGAADGLMYALLIAVVLDYITGVCVAIHHHELSSNIGAKGIAKKVSIFALVSVSNIIDVYLLKSGTAIRSVTTTFYLVNECISILENANQVGLPLPEKLANVLLAVKPVEQKKSDTNK